MALRNTPAFEDMDDNTVEAAVAVNEVAAETTVQNDAPAANADTLAKVQAIVDKVPAAIVPVSAAGRAMANVLKSSTALDDLQNVIGADMLENMSYGAFPRIVVAPGAFNDKKAGKPLGDTLEIEIHSWNFVTIVSANENNNKEADKELRTSYDGKNLINNEGTVEAHLAKLHAKGYDRAAAKKYLEIYCTVFRTGKGPVPEEEQTLTQISVPPTSTGPWGAFLLSQRMAAAKGKAVSARVKLEAGSMSKNGNTWGTIDFKAA